MRKVFNIVFYLVLTIIVVLTGALSYHYYRMPTRLTPAPYAVKEGVYQQDDIASNSDALIVGDDMGVSLGPYVNEITTELSKKLARPLSIYNISVRDEALFRTIERLKNLKKIPKILIIATGFSQMQEQLYPKSKSAMKRNDLNFKIYRNLYLQSLMQVYPSISRLAYTSESINLIGKEIKEIDYTEIDDNRFRNILSKELLLFDNTFEKLLRDLKSKGINVIVLIPPVNVELSDLKVCKDTTTTAIEEALKKLSNLLDKNKTKEAQILVKTLDKSIIANSRYHQLKEKLYQKQGEYTKAYEQALLKLSFACEVKSSHPMFVTMLKKNAQAQNVDIIDFDNIVKEGYMRGPLFITRKNPQSTFYSKLIEEIIIKLKQVTQLR